jgi:cold shock CspA family protein
MSSLIVETNPELVFESSSSEIPQQPATVKKTLGIVKWFDSRGGFGFITILPGETNAGKDIFVHYSSLSVAQSQYKYLVLGEYVEFVVSSSDNEKYEFSAKEVSGVRGGNLMCESRRLSALETRPEDPQSQQQQQQQQPIRVATHNHEHGARVGGEKHYRIHDANLIGAPGRRLPAQAQGRGSGRIYSATTSVTSVTTAPNQQQDGDFIPVTRKRNRRMSEAAAHA